MTKLTTETLLAIASPSAGERIELRDPAEPGLIFRVLAQRRKVVERPLPQQRRRTPPKDHWRISDYRHRPRPSACPPDQGAARRRAKIRVGQEKEARAEVQRARLNTLDGLFEEYIADAKIGMHRVNGRAKRPSTMYQMERNFDRLLRPTLGNRAVASINRRDILDLVAQKSRLARSNGFYIRSIMQQLMRYAELKEIVEISPVRNIPVPPQTPRDRVLADHELRAIWQATDDLHPSMKLAIRLIMATLARGNEICALRWSEIDRKARTLTIPASRMKNAKINVVPLSDLALDLLDEAAEMGDPVFVLPSAKRSGQPVLRLSVGAVFLRIATNLGFEKATPHDMRRTGATCMTSERLNVPLSVVSKVLSHTSSGAA